MYWHLGAFAAQAAPDNKKAPTTANAACDLIEHSPFKKIDSPENDAPHEMRVQDFYLAALHDQS
jgi:hypothetical protein